MKGYKPLSVLCVLCNVFGGVMIGNGLQNIEKLRIAIPQVGIGIAFVLAGWFLQTKIVSDYGRFKTKNLKKVKAKQCSVLVLLLSPIAGPLIPSHIKITGNMEKDLEQWAAIKREQHITLLKNPSAGRMPFWSWEQPLRAIFHNLKGRKRPLKHLIIIGSKQSIVQLNDFADLVLRKYEQFLGENSIKLQTFLKRGRKLVDIGTPAKNFSKENGWDFENFDEMTDVLDSLLKHLMKGYKGHDISIDFTGGQKPASVVAAVVTIFSSVSNQYVATNPKDEGDSIWQYPVWGYDLHKVPVPTD